MRVVAGEFKGRVIESPSAKTTRPTTDRVRESMFSSIYSRREDLSATRVLDAFAGSGALGIEALSREANSCIFFERDAEARKVLERNLAGLGLSAPRATVRGVDVVEASHASLCGSGQPFGLVMLDPPYAVVPEAVRDFCMALGSNGDLEEHCIIAYEHDLKNKREVESAFEAAETLEVLTQKKYGKIGVTYIRYATV